MSDMYLSRINRAALTPEQTVLEAEERYTAHIEQTADRVLLHGGVSVILLAGPSGAGKTTTANLLADAVRSRGKYARVISLDDFYRDHSDADYPRLENGERDMESPHALRLGLVNETIGRILEKKPFFVPHYDFKEARPDPVPVAYDAITEGCVIIEGLHALNPAISGEVVGGGVIKLFVSVSTNIVEDETGQRLLSGRKMRFIRRTVRDKLYRDATADETLAVWKSVLSGEDRYLYPYKHTADLHFDTFHLFEPGVLAPFMAEAMTESAMADPYVKEVMRAVGRFAPIGEAYVPDSSLIREFIPGGKYRHLY